MDALTISLELAEIREKTRRLAMWSLLAHAAGLVVFLVVVSQPRTARDDNYIITEITWLEPDLEYVEAEIKLAVAEPKPVAVKPSVVVEKPQPVMPARENSVELVGQRLAALRADDAGRNEITTAAAAMTARPQADPATLGAFAPRKSTSAQGLNRAPIGAVSRPTELPKRQPTVVAAAVTALPESDRDAHTAPAQEILPGISLAGEVSERRLMAYTTPDYPEWAKRDGVEVSVELFFTVLPSGQVKENVLVERTSGFDDFDSRAKNALTTWRFEKLGPGLAGEQWGRIEFKYRLKDAG